MNGDEQDRPTRLNEATGAIEAWDGSQWVARDAESLDEYRALVARWATTRLGGLNERENIPNGMAAAAEMVVAHDSPALWLLLRHRDQQIRDALRQQHDGLMKVLRAGFSKHTRVRKANLEAT